MAMTKETEAKLQELQMIEQNINNFSMQKQSFQMELIEAESALSELAKVSSAYRIIGNIMVLSSKEDVEKELSSKKEIVELRLATIEKQETKLKEKAAKLQKDVLGEMKEQ